MAVADAGPGSVTGPPPRARGAERTAIPAWAVPLVLVGAGIVLNVGLGQVVRNILRLPVYMDSIGTILAGALGGPLVGAATGALSNVVWGLLFDDPKIIPYAITAAAVGVAAGIAGSLGAFRKPQWAILAGLVAGTPVISGGASIAKAELLRRREAGEP